MRHAEHVQAPEPRPHSKAGEVYLLLRQDILNGSLPPGSKLGLVMLRDRYGAGIAPTREALIRLASAGLAVGEEQRGFRVPPISESDLRDITGVSVLVESEAITRAIGLAGPASDSLALSAFDHLLAVDVQAPGRTTVMNEPWAVAHRKFHEALVMPCGSPWLMTLRSLLFDQADRYRRLSFALDPGRDMTGEHRRLLDAVLERDIGMATTLVEQHWASTADIIDEKARPAFWLPSA